MDLKLLSNIPGHTCSEYHLVLRPNTYLEEKINAVKEEFFLTYNSGNIIHYPVQMLLARFIQFDMPEDRLITRLKNIARCYAPFMIELKDFGSFPSHTLFINVASKQSIQNLVRKIKTAQKLMTIIKLSKPWFVQEPYFIIATKLLPWQYEKGWEEYKVRHFFEKFMADKFLLLKRPLAEHSGRNINTGKFEIVENFSFTNMIESEQQGSLF